MSHSTFKTSTLKCRACGGRGCFDLAIRQIGKLSVSSDIAKKNAITSTIKVKREHTAYNVPANKCRNGWDYQHLAKAIEREMGRSYKQKEGYEDRIIDIDILLYDDCVLSTPNLTIPHPLIPQRDFVLLPMAEIAPHLIHPTEKCSFQELLNRWKASSISGE